MAGTVPLTVTREASEFVGRLKLHNVVQQLLSNTPTRFPGVQAITVSLAPRYDEDSGPEVIFEVTRARQSDDHPAEENWRQWIIESFPPEVFTHFCLVSDF